MKKQEIDELARWACLQENISGVLDLFESQQEIYRLLRNNLVMRDLERVARASKLYMNFDDSLINTGRGTLSFSRQPDGKSPFFICFSFDKGAVYGISCEERYRGIPMEQIYENESDEFWPYGWSYLRLPADDDSKAAEVGGLTSPEAMRAIADGRMTKAIEDAIHDAMALNLLERLDN